ncbi:hypothetical protein O0S10_03155 [Methanocorpusculum sp. MG]|uniref:Uncharacterized protein n=1 Tax=Methanocorpusculum petauri TaxID=3002863 RepID=A0ABT4IER3_9EURY|nr:hypothetical protein [Methanocorpusculum petauri]MCZ0860229.1 hypothetical protein [Methanocorpusculum petauri]
MDKKYNRKINPADVKNKPEKTRNKKITPETKISWHPGKNHPQTPSTKNGIRVCDQSY